MSLFLFGLGRAGINAGPGLFPKGSMAADPHMHLRDTIRQAMDARGLSQRSLSRLAGLSHSTLCRFLNNRCNLSSHSLAMVMRAAGLEISAPREGKER